MARSPPMQTPRMPGPQPLPWACSTASRMALRQPSRSRLALSFSLGSEYCAPTFSQPPPLRMSRTLTSGERMLVKMNGGRAGTDVGAVVLAGEGIHGVLAEEALLGGELDGLAGGLLEGGLVEADGAIDVEDDAAGVLADGLGLGFGQRDVLLDDLHRASGDGALLFTFERIEDGLVHVVRDFGRGAADEFQQRVLQHIHRTQAKREGRASQPGERVIRWAAAGSRRRSGDEGVISPLASPAARTYRGGRRIAGRNARRARAAAAGSA